MPNPAIRPGSDEEWEALLRQLRQPPKAQPRPFFYVRVRTRLAAQPSAARHGLPGWLRRPAYAALLGALVLVVSRDGATLHPTAAPGHYQSAQPPLLPR